MRNSMFLALSSLVVVLILLLFVLSALLGCAARPPPTTQLIIQDIAQTTGYVIGKNNPKLAKEFIHYTQVDREDILVLYDSWKRYLAYRLVDDEFLRMKVERMLSLMDIRLELRTDEEKVTIIRELFLEFISGLEAGINL